MPKKIDLNTRRADRSSDENGINVLHGLDDLCKNYITKDTSMIEMGCLDGVSTSLFAHYAKIVHTIDNNPEPIRTRLYENIIFYKGPFKRIFPKLTLAYPDKFDLIYIDGSHYYERVCQDIELALTLIKDTGYISGHDYTHLEYSDVIKAVEDRLKVKPEVFSDSSWIIKVSDLND